jgi:hypothetical protein
MQGVLCAPCSGDLSGADTGTGKIRPEWSGRIGVSDLL